LERVKTGAVAVTPAWLERIPSDELPAQKLKAGVRVTHARPRDVAQHVWFAAASSAGAGASQMLEWKIGFFAVIPLDRQLFADQLNVLWFKSHGAAVAEIPKKQNPNPKQISKTKFKIPNSRSGQVRLPLVPMEWDLSIPWDLVFWGFHVSGGIFA
jgi:hypothetical protein